MSIFVGTITFAISTDANMLVTFEVYGHDKASFIGI